MIYQKRRLHFGPKSNDLSAQVADYRGPVYVYEWQGIAKRVEVLRHSFGLSAQLHYAMKANSHPSILKSFAAVGVGVDTVSEGEIRLAMECGIPADKIIFSGVGKSSQEITTALDAKILQINVESESELKRIIQIARDRKTPAKVALRLNPNIDAKTHPYITTGAQENKFGLDEQSAMACMQLIKESPSQVSLQGLAIHIGSQILDVNVFEQAASWLIRFAERLKGQGVIVTHLDFGGGVGIFYDRDDDDGEFSLVRDYGDLLQKLLKLGSYVPILEPGRFLVGHSGVLLTRVEYLKKTPQKMFVVVDTGVHHLIRPALYGARHRIFPLLESADLDKHVYDVVGPLCESSDVLAREVKLGTLREGDFLAIADCGAYGFEMASEYNLRSKPDRVLLP